jgi:hypothetical protein
MATSNSTDDIKIQNLKVEESTTTKEEAAADATKGKAAKPKKEKPKQEKPQVAAAVEAPAEELDFNRTAEEIEKALKQWSTKPSTLNKPKPDEKM